MVTRINSLGPKTRDNEASIEANTLVVTKMMCRTGCGCSKTCPNLARAARSCKSAKRDLFGKIDIQRFARPRGLRESIVGFVTTHGLLFNADRSRS